MSQRAVSIPSLFALPAPPTTTPPPPLRLQVYNPYLLISKKRYAGLLWTTPDKWDKMDTKGIETVRRDNCALVRNVISTCLDKLLIDRDAAAAAAFAKATISDLLMNRLDLSLLVITKAYAKAEYEGKQAHVELAKRMKARDPATAPAVGDRVAYVIVKAAKGAKAWEKAEDPVRRGAGGWRGRGGEAGAVAPTRVPSPPRRQVWALDHSLPIDAQHYLDHHLAQPLLRIFEPIMKDPRSLLAGAHTRAIAVSTPTAAAGGIMRFAKVRLTCLGCRAPLAEGGGALCAHCKPKVGGGRREESGPRRRERARSHPNPSRTLSPPLFQEAEVYSRALAATTSLEDAFASLWTQCQRCQGSLHADVLCTSRDCPIFYRRKKVAKDLTEAAGALARFPDEW